MKNISIFFLMFLSGCTSTKTNSYRLTNDEDRIECKVIRINVVSNYYVIYAIGVDHNEGYKIISRKKVQNVNVRKHSSKGNPKEVIINKKYKFKLTWISLPDSTEAKGNYLEFKRCVTRFPLVEICTEAGFELYETPNLNGLDYLDR